MSEIGKKGQPAAENKSPATLGYRMPAEWEWHRATWLTWPRPDGISFEGCYDAILPVFGQLAASLSTSEWVEINVWDREMESAARHVLQKAGVVMDHVGFHYFPAYEPWCRDHGPIFVTRERGGSREKAVVDWQYNAWGGKYPPYDLDDAVPKRIAEESGVPRFAPGIVLEGGSIDVNGEGALLTTEACLLNPNRNPALSQREIEAGLVDFLAVNKVIWLGDGIAGDDTDGHVDDIARFVAPRVIAAVVEEDPHGVDYEVLQENYRRLLKATDACGRPFEVVALPTPGNVEASGVRLPASYANFYVGNRVVMVPTFHSVNDRKALELLQTLFPNRRVIGLDATILVQGLGTFHCLTQQEPE